MPRIFVSVNIILLILSPLFSHLAVTDDWVTHTERTEFRETPRYNETMEYFKKLAGSSPYAEIMKIGVTPQGRDIHSVAVSADGIFTPVDLSRRSKPLILIINGTHPGEIGGKDASMILLREMLITGEKRYLLDNVNLLVIPVFNVDGHERFGPYNRINQNGPEEMGWRTTAQNYNLNRDWTKADSPEMRAMLNLISGWLPDFIIDTHSTNGADYQYTVTYLTERHRNIYEETAMWTKETFIPFMEKYVRSGGYEVFPYVTMRNWFGGVDTGITGGAASPRFSNGYAAVQNRPALVVETHMLKPYKARVMATKAMIESVIRYAYENPRLLIDLNRNADWISVEKYHAVGTYLPVDFKLSDNYRSVEFKGIEAVREKGELAGTEVIRYTGKPVTKRVRYYDDVIVTDSVTVPRLYLIPKEWGEIAERMKIHGIRVETLVESAMLPVTRYRFTDFEFAAASFEGRHRVDAGYESFREWRFVPEGTYVVPTDQRTIRVITHLLEPKSPDSYLRWGFFNSIFERKEYFELYVMEPLAQEMIRENPALKIRFEEWLKENPRIKDDPYRRLYFFYEKSPYYDEQYKLYPVMRVE